MAMITILALVLFKGHLVYAQTTAESSLAAPGNVDDLHSQFAGISRSMSIAEITQYAFEAHSFMDGYITNGYSDMVTAVETTNNFMAQLTFKAASSIDVVENAEVDMTSLITYGVDLTTDVFRATKIVESQLLALLKLEPSITTAETNLIAMFELMLNKTSFSKKNGKWKRKYIEPLEFGNIYMDAMGIKAKGRDLPVDYKTAKGGFSLPYYETFNDKRKKKNVTVVVFTYFESPYIYLENPEVVGSNVVKIHLVDEDGSVTGPAITETKDGDDPSEFSLGSPKLSGTSGFANMLETATDSGVYLSYVDTNSTAKGFLLEIMLRSIRICDIYGKYETFPSAKDYDMYIKTKGRSRIMLQHPKDLRIAFQQQQLKIVLPPSSADESVRPLVITTSCEDDRTDDAKRRRRSLSLVEHQFRSAGLAVNAMNGQTNWSASDLLENFGAEGNTITFKSNLLGIFSADMFFIAPSPIDFSRIFAQFSETFEDSPYAFAAILIILVTCIPITLLLRRLDKSDQIMWQFLPLKDNPQGHNDVYYVTVETSVRSDKELRANVYINIIGNKGSTGTRLLDDGVRKNFKRGTSSHFKLETYNDVGEIKRVQIWHDGEDRTCWNLHKVLIVRQADKARYTFLSGKRLSLDSDDGNTWCSLQVLEPQNVTVDTLFYGLSHRKLFDDYLWISLIKRPQYSRFNRVQRLWSLITLIFLAMIASAMWYDVPDDNNTMQTIVLGTLKLNYKQFFVGFMCGLITLPVSFSLVMIFRNRKFKGETTAGCFIPWWFIFIAYSLIAVCISVSGTFVFLYSLDWGGEKTLDWIIAFLFSIVQSIIVLEPTKAILIAIVIACLFRGLGSRELSDSTVPVPMNKTSRRESYISDLEATEDPIKRDYPSFPGDGEETKDQALIRRRLQMDRKMWTKFKEWLGILLYVVLVTAICSHNDVTNAYRQNEHLLNTLSNISKPNRSDEIFDYLRTTYIRAAYPKWWESEDDEMLRPAYIQRFMLNTYNYRFTLTRIRQVRVKDYCDYPDEVDNITESCIPSYNEDTEETGNFCPLWQEYNDTGCFDENEEHHYSFLHSLSREDQLEKAEDSPYIGSHGKYGPEGYFLDLGPKQSLVLLYLDILQMEDWINSRTRAVFVDLVSYNANSRLFSQVKLVFELPTVGGVTMATHVWSANFYPYQTALDFIVLALQLIFLVVWLVRFVFFLVFLFRNKLSSFLLLDTYVKLLDLGFGLAAIVFYILRIDATIAAINILKTTIGRYVSFEKIWEYDRAYKACLSSVLFVAILDLLKPLEFNHSFFTMINSLRIARGALAGFLVITMLEITSFACLLHLTIGRNYVLFKSVPDSIFSLLTVLLAMRKYNSEEFNDITIKFYFGLYTFTLTITLVNVFLTVLAVSLTEAQQEVKDGKSKFDKEMNEHFWYKVDQAVEWIISKFCFTPRTQDTPEDKAYERKIEIRLTKMQQVSKEIFKHDIQRYKQAGEMMMKIIKWKYQRTFLDCLNVERNRYAIKYIFGFKRTGEKLVILTVPSRSLTAELKISCEYKPKLLKDIPRRHKQKPLGKIYGLKTKDKFELMGCVILEVLNSKDDNNTFDTILAGDKVDSKWNEGESYKTTSGVMSVLLSIPEKFCAVHTGRSRPLTKWKPSETYIVTPEGGCYYPSYDPTAMIHFEENSFLNFCRVSLRTMDGPDMSVLNVTLDFPPLKDTEFEFQSVNNTEDFPVRSDNQNFAQYIIVNREGPSHDWERINSTLHGTKNSFKFGIKKKWKSLEVTVKVSKIHWLQHFKQSFKREIPIIKAIVTVSQVPDIAYKWPQILHFLKFDEADVFVEDDEILCQEEKCFMILEKWIQLTEVTFPMLIDLLKALGFYVTAEHIRSKWMVDTDESKSDKLNTREFVFPEQ